ncbi:Spy/CpxP family protein refolding chaperone [Nitrincola sp. MINF-07-Sa-05]|uniref:Spy/CpxP family protein refolding chaperone n=1 Tax=Nitrincola salilacus TaxID=3400273 RepID=UPI003917C33E
MNISKNSLLQGLSILLLTAMSSQVIAQGMGSGMDSGMMDSDKMESVPSGQSGMKSGADSPMSKGGMGMMGGMMSGGMQGGMMSGMGSGMMDSCPMMEGGMGMMGAGMHAQLTPEQRLEVRKLRHAHRPVQFEQMGQLMNLREDLMEKMSSDRPNPDEIKVLHSQIAEMHGEMLVARIKLNNAIQDLLTDEQRQTLLESPAVDSDETDHAAHH